LFDTGVSCGVDEATPPIWLFSWVLTGEPVITDGLACETSGVAPPPLTKEGVELFKSTPLTALVRRDELPFVWAVGEFLFAGLFFQPLLAGLERKKE